MHRLLAVLLGAIWTLGAAEVTTIAGTGKSGYSGDGGPPAAAQLGNPYGLVVGPDGALYVCEVDNHVIRRLDRKTGTLSSVAGTGQKGYSGDGGPATAATLNQPYEIRFDRSGNMFFVEMQNHLVRRVDARTRVISTVAGTGEAGFSGDAGPAVKAQFRQPHSIAFDRQGRLYIADIGNHRIRRVDLKTGGIETIMYLEDAMLMSNPQTYARLAAETSVPICMSETLASRYEYREFFELKACDVVMYDLTWCGGVSEAKKISDMADTYYLPTSPHTCGGPLLYICSAHLCTALSNFLIMESNYWKYTHQYPHFVSNAPVPENGQVRPPEAPGIGAGIKPELFRNGDAIVETVAKR